MSETAQFFLVFLGLPAIVGVSVLLIVAVEWATWHVQNAVAHCQGQLGNWRFDTAARSLRQEDDKAFLQWLAAKTGDDIRGAVDHGLIEAQKHSESIRFLIEEEVPKAVMQCVETHRVLAHVTGACHLFEIAYEPECYQLRAKVIWLLAHTVRLLEAYPLRLDDARLLHNSIVLRKRALPTCRRCPYIQLPVEQAPRLCPTAQLVQLRGVLLERAG